MTMTSDLEIWRAFLDFRIEECLGFWSDAIIDFPFGKLLLFDPTDDVCLVKKADLTQAPAYEIVDMTESYSKALGLRAGFMISPAWVGDVAGFEKYIGSRGYRPSMELIWFLKTDFSNIDEIPESDFSIHVAGDKDIDAVVTLYQQSLEMPDVLCARLKRRLERKTGTIDVGFVLARGSGGGAVALGGYSLRAPIAYTHGLGTLPEFRRLGIARHMLKVRYQIFRERGAKWIISSVLAGNVPSIEHVQSLGSRAFQRSQTWRKPE